MTNLHHKFLATVLLTIAVSGVAPAQTHAEPAVSPEASKVLKKTGEALRGLRGYEMEMKGSTRAALGGGKYRDFAGTVHYVVSPPDRLAAHVLGEAAERRVIYDGKSIVVYAPRQKSTHVSRRRATSRPSSRRWTPSPASSCRSPACSRGEAPRTP